MRRLAAFALALDVGTSSVRASIFDSRGDAVPGTTSQLGNRVHYGRDGAAELDALELWERVQAAVDGALMGWRTAARPEGRIVAVGAACFWHSLLGVDDHGDPVSPVLTWADVRAALAARSLGERVDADAVRARTGCRLHASYLPAKLAWVRREHPDWWSTAVRWVGLGAFLTAHLHGSWVSSLSDVSASGLWDQRSGQWDAELLDAVGIGYARLPEVADLSECDLHLHRSLAQRWPELAEARWLLPVGDGACNNLGAGATDSRTVVLMVGTSGAVRVLHRGGLQPLPATLWQYRLDRGRAVVGGALSNGGNLVQWLVETLRVEPADLEAALATRQPDGHGLTFLPLLAGERSPGWAPDAYGAVVGLRAATAAIDIAAAALEAAATRFAAICADLEGVFGPATRMVGTGGGFSRGTLWSKLLADAIGRPVATSKQPEATSRGAALLALEASGAIEAAEAVPAGVEPAVWPDPARHRVYGEVGARTQGLYQRLGIGSGAFPSGG